MQRVFNRTGVQARLKSILYTSLDAFRWSKVLTHGAMKKLRRGRKKNRRTETQLFCNPCANRRLAQESRGPPRAETQSPGATQFRCVH